MPILSSDFDAGNNNGYVFSSNGVSYAIKAGVTLLTNSIGGVVGVYDPTGVDSARVANDGTIVSSTGVYISGDDAQVSNGATGEIHADEGIRLVGSDGTTISNDGHISGAVRGIDIENSGRTTVLNTGIMSAIYGIDASDTTECFLANSGTIVGDFYSIIVTSATSIHLNNSGQLTGDVRLEASSGTTLRNSGTISGDVTLGDGADVFKGKIGIVTGVVDGFDGDDQLSAGNNGASLSGGAGDDILTGGKGEDAFIFESQFNAATNVDDIRKFKHGDDLIEFNSLVITGLKLGELAAGVFKVIDSATSTKGVDASDRILYDKADGNLYFDADGSGTASERIKFAHLHPGTNLDASDFLVF